jgi:hypothetical protein
MRLAGRFPFYNPSFFIFATKIGKKNDPSKKE